MRRAVAAAAAVCAGAWRAEALIASIGGGSVTVPHQPARFGPTFDGQDGVHGPAKEPASLVLCGNSGEDFKGAIALVARGECTFYTKVKNAQSLGAVGVVVYSDDAQISADELVTMSVDSAEMARDIVIPSVFISYNSYGLFDDMMDAASNGTLTLLINGTGASESDPYDASPVFLRSVVFMLQVLLMLWTLTAIMYLFNVIASRLARRRRMQIVKRLPTRIFRAGELVPDAESPVDALPIRPAGRAAADGNVSREARPVNGGSDSGQGQLDDDSDGSSAAESPVSPAVVDPTMPRHPKHRDMVRLPLDDVEIEMRTITDNQGNSPSSCSQVSIVVENDSQSSSEDSPGPLAAPVASSSSTPGYYHSDNCVICLCLFEDGERLTVLPCGHGYHKDCIEPWLVHKSALCPICKQSILPSGDSRSLEEISNDSESSGSDAQRSERSVCSIMIYFVGMLFAFSAASGLLYVIKLDQ